MTENIKRLLTDASIISTIVVYSYIVYLSGEVGYLNAYGITDPTSLIPLEIQSVIFGFLQGIVYFVTFVGVILLAMTLVVSKVGPKVSIRDSKRIKTLLFLCTTTVALLEIPFLKDSYGSIVAIIMFLSLMVIIFLMIFARIPRTSSSFIGLVEILVEKFTRADNPRQSGSKRFFLLASTMAIVLVPLFSFAINYDRVSIESREQIIKIVTLNNRKYVLIRQYSDKNLLVQLEGNKLLPNYIILRGEQTAKVSYSLERKTINRSSLFPKSSEVVQLGEYMHGLLAPHK